MENWPAIRNGRRTQKRKINYKVVPTAAQVGPCQAAGHEYETVLRDAILAVERDHRDQGLDPFITK
jgi:hypothetical protein